MSIQKELDKIKNAVYGREVRGAIHDGIKKAYDDASENGNANMEVKMARGAYGTLGERLTTEKEYVNKQLQVNQNAYKESYETVQELLSAYPAGDSYNHVVITKNEIYTYHQGNWVSTGVVPVSATIDRDSVESEHVSFIGGQNLHIQYGDKGISRSKITVVEGFITSNIPIKNGRTYTIRVDGQHNQWVVGLSDSLVAGSPVDVILTEGAGSFKDSKFTFTNNSNKKYVTIVLAYAYSGFKAELYVTDSDRLTIGKTEVVKNDRLSVYNGKRRPAAIVPEELSSMYNYHGILDSTNDLNGVLKSGVYLIQDSSKPLNYPLNETGILIQTNYYYANYSHQKVISYISAGIEINRQVANGKGEWVQPFSGELFGKTLLTIGDSLTQPNKYQKYIKKKTGATIVSSGADGAKYAMRRDHEPYNSNSFYKLSETIAVDNVDVLFVAFGTNDFSNGVPIVNDENDEYSLKGAMRKGVENFLTRKPDLKILVSLPIYRATVDGSTFEDIETTANWNGGYMRDYVKAIKEVCLEFNLPFYDGFNKCGINKFNHTTYLSDKLHLTTEGYELIGNKYGEFIVNNV